MNNRPVTITVTAGKLGAIQQNPTADATHGSRPTAMPTRTSWHKAGIMPSLVAESGDKIPTESKQSMWAGERRTDRHGMSD